MYCHRNRDRRHGRRDPDKSLPRHRGLVVCCDWEGGRRDGVAAMRRILNDDRGISGALDMTLAVGLIMLPLVMLVASIPRRVETKSMAEVAAQEAARTLVLSNQQGIGETAAEAAARQIVANHGVDPSTVSVSFTGILDWGQEITATVTVRMPVLSIPLIGEFSVADYSAVHTERVDDYRSFAP